jgi:hypothetical protein
VVEEYTLERVRAFGLAIDRDRKRRERALAQLIRAGSQYDAPSFAEFLKD